MLRIIIPILLVFILIVISYYKRYEGFEDTVLKSSVQSKLAMQNTSIENQNPIMEQNQIPTISVSGTAYDAMSLQQRSDILKDIQQAVKNEILANRQTEVIPTQNNINTTNSIQQGQEFNTNKQVKTKETQEYSNGGCPPIPDMSQYIRKDEIPCWNCTLDY